MYKKIDIKDYEYLKNIVGIENTLFENEVGHDYHKDELGGISNPPDLVLKVDNAFQISQIMKYAYDNTIPVVVRGSGTGLVGASVAMHGGIMIDMTKMNRFLDLDLNNLTLTLEPGVLLMDIYKHVEEQDLFYPPDPGEKSATIGGNISTNAGGMRAVKYGVTRDYVRELEVVLPNGELFTTGGKVVKNSSGYALKDLMIGAEGTLGIITKATLKLLPLPKYSISLLLPFPSIESAIECVPKIIKSKAIPTAIEFIQKEVLLYAEDFLGKKFPDKSAEAYILLSFDGNTLESVESDYSKVADLCIKEGALDAYIVDTEERKKDVWSARGAFLEAIKASTDLMDECDVVVPRDKVADFIKFTKELEEKYKVRIPSFGHAGDGNLHIYVCKDGMEENKWEKTLENIFEEMYSRAREYKGLVSGEHGIGYAKKKYLFEQIGDVQIGIMQGIKSIFDPKFILNPGKVVK